MAKPELSWMALLRPQPGHPCSPVAGNNIPIKKARVSTAATKSTRQTVSMSDSDDELDVEVKIFLKSLV